MNFDELLQKRPTNYVKNTAFQAGEIYQIRDDREQARTDNLRYIEILRIKDQDVDFRYRTLEQDTPRDNDHFQPRSIFAGLLRYVAPNYGEFLKLQAI